jgi:hypothetical protein
MRFGFPQGSRQLPAGSFKGVGKGKGTKKQRPSLTGSYAMGTGLAGLLMTESTNGGANWTDDDTFLFHDGAIADSGAGGRIGFWLTSPAEDLAATLAAGGLDMEMEFAWNSTADTTQEVWFVGLYTNPGAGQLPGFIGVGVDRNNNRMMCGRGIGANEDHTVGIQTFVNGTSLHTLVGDELTADGATLHTVGFKLTVVGSTYTWVPYFDGTAQVTGYDLADDTHEDDVAVAVDRVGVLHQYANVTGVHTLFKTIRIGPAGSIYV